jgi:hypothetical protein
LLLLLHLALLLHGLQLLTQSSHLLLEGGGGSGWLCRGGLLLLWRGRRPQDVQATGWTGLLPLEPGPNIITISEQITVTSTSASPGIYLRLYSSSPVTK